MKSIAMKSAELKEKPNARNGKPKGRKVIIKKWLALKVAAKVGTQMVAKVVVEAEMQMEVKAVVINPQQEVKVHLQQEAIKLL